MIIIYSPEGMTLIEKLNECWIILKNELSKEGKYCIDKFKNYIFVDLFTNKIKKSVLMIIRDFYIWRWFRIIDSKEYCKI